MTNRELTALRAELLTEKTRLIKRVMAVEAEARDSDPVGAPEDQLDQANNREWLLTLSNQERSQLRQIDKAIELIQTGDYGSCSLCRLAISPIRLKAAPWARFCLRCQDALERRDFTSLGSRKGTTL